MVLTKRQRTNALRIGFYVATAVAIVLVVVVPDWGELQQAFFQWDIASEQFPDIITTAAKNTVLFTIYGFGGGLVLGLVLALMRISSFRPYRLFSATVIDVIRGLPALLLILLIGFALPIATDVRMSRVGRASVALAIVASAYIAETIRAGIGAIPPGQMEAARSLGMSYGRAMVTVILPQAFRVIIPPMTNELVLLLKDTALVSVIGFTTAERELTRFGRDGVVSSANATPLVVAGLVYLALTIPLTRLSAHLERRAGRHR
jgi:polar amino acid transport system permease protein